MAISRLAISLDFPCYQQTWSINIVFTMHNMPSLTICNQRPVRFLQHSEVYYSMLQHACAVGASVCDVTAVWRHLPQHRSFCCSIYLCAAVDERGAIRKPFAPCCSCVTSPMCDVMQHRIFCRKPNRPQSHGVAKSLGHNQPTACVEVMGVNFKYIIYGK